MPLLLSGLLALSAHSGAGENPRLTELGIKEQQWTNVVGTFTSKFKTDFFHN